MILLTSRTKAQVQLRCMRKMCTLVPVWILWSSSEFYTGSLYGRLCSNIVQQQQRQLYEAQLHTVLTGNPKNTHLQTESRSSTGTLSRINRAELGPSTSPQQLTSASVEPSETASAPDEFYKPHALYFALKQPTPTPQRRHTTSNTTPSGPVSTFDLRFNFKKMFFQTQLRQRQNSVRAKDQLHCTV